MSKPQDLPLAPSARRSPPPPLPPAGWLSRLGSIDPVKPEEVREWWEKRVPLIVPMTSLPLLAVWEEDLRKEPEGDRTAEVAIPLARFLRSACSARTAVTFNALWKERKGGRIYPYFLSGYDGPLTMSRYAYEKAGKDAPRLLLSAIRKDVRRNLTLSPRWTLLSADFRSCHGYISFALSGDEQLRVDLEEGFHEITGGWLLAADASPTLARKVGKYVNNAMIFGLGAPGLKRLLDRVLEENLPLEWAEKAWNVWWDRYPRLREFRDGVKQSVLAHQCRGKRLSFISPSGRKVSFSPAEVKGVIYHQSRRDPPGSKGAWRAIFSSIFRAVEADLLDQQIRYLHAIKEHHGCELVLPIYDGLLLAAPRGREEFAMHAIRTCGSFAAADLCLSGLTVTTSAARGT
jgi:hypothetical protein